MNSHITVFESHNPKLKRRISEYLELIFNNSSDSFLNAQVLTRFLWTATEDSDSEERVKYLGQPYWSKNAIIHYQNQNTGRKRKNFTDLRHDHSVPKIIIYQKIMNLTEANRKIKSTEIFEILDKFAHAVVITKEEDKRLKEVGLNQKLPDDLKITTRYSQANIEIVYVKDTDLKEIQF